MSDRIILVGKKDPEIYNQRVNRTEVFLGVDEQEQKKAQQILAESTVGIAGAGGIGGAMALRLARFGVKCIKIADPELFDWTNVNRQLGASKANIGKNKSEVVGNIVYELAEDITVEIFKDGITVENASEFVEDCDIVLDQIEFFTLKEKYALHRAFRAESKAVCILLCSVIGWNAHMYKFEKDSMTVEEWYGIPEDTVFDDVQTDKLVKLWAPKFPPFPSYQEVRHWMKDNNAAPIFAGAPPLAEGILTQRVILSLLGKEHPPYAKWLPPIPQMYIYDAATLSGEIVTSDGEIKNLKELEIAWSVYNQSKKWSGEQRVT